MKNFLMKLNKTFLVATTTAAAFLAFTMDSKGEEDGKLDRYTATDAVVATISSNITDLQTIVVIDHSRLAEKEGVKMPPSTVTIYSDPEVDAALMKLNPRVGLDLPSKILVFDATGQVRVSYPEASFLAKRHGLTDEAALNRYQESIDRGLEGIEAGLMEPVSDQGVARDDGIIELISDFDYDDTMKRLKEAVMKEGDTVWFGDLNFHAAAVEAGVDVSPSTLLLFGGPKPGGVAMAEFPKLGLDAFCQKLLVYQDGDGQVRVIFNDIARMAELHYGKSAQPHDVINGRLAALFESAVKKTEE